MNLANIIVQAGGMHRAAQDYDEEQAQRGYAARAREHGVKAMDQRERLMPGQTSNELLRQEIARTELEAKKILQPDIHAMEASDVSHRRSLQPGVQEYDRGALALARGQQGLQTSQVQTAQQLQPGQAKIATEEQKLQLQTLRQQQGANLWGLLNSGDKAGTLELLNSSGLLHEGRKFSDIIRGEVPVRGNDGQPLMQNGKPVMEEYLLLTPADGGEPVMRPVEPLKKNYEKFGVKFEKVGNNIVRIGADGTVKPVYEPDQFGTNSETGQVYSKRTGLPPAAAGVPGAAAPGPGRKAESHLDDRVKMAIDKVILPKFGGRFEGGMFFPDEKNKEVAQRAIQLAGELVRRGTAPEAAGVQAVQQAEREKALTDAASGKGGGGAAAPYTGPTPWR